MHEVRKALLVATNLSFAMERNRPEPPPAQIVVVQNLFEELKRLVPAQ